MGEDYGRPSLVLGRRIVEGRILVDGDRGIMEMSRKKGEKFGQHGANSKELGVCDKMLSLRGRQPANALLIRLRDGRVKHAVLNGVDVVGALGGRRRSLKLRHGNLDIDGSDLIRPGVFGEGGHGAQTRKVRGHLGSWCRVHGESSNREWVMVMLNQISREIRLLVKCSDRDKTKRFDVKKGM